MSTNEATRRDCHHDRARVSARDAYMIPDWAAMLLGAAMGAPFLWSAVMW